MKLQHLTQSNLHTHTSFADGKNTAEEVVLSAIENDSPPDAKPYSSTKEVMTLMASLAVFAL